jgi:hypothetical protein
MYSLPRKTIYKRCKLHIYTIFYGVCGTNTARKRYDTVGDSKIKQEESTTADQDDRYK